MMFTINLPLAPLVSIASQLDLPSLLNTTAMYQLTNVKRIQSLKCKLFVLCTRGGIWMRAQAQVDYDSQEDTPEVNNCHSILPTPTPPWQAPSQPAAAVTKPLPLALTEPLVVGLRQIAFIISFL